MAIEGINSSVQALKNKSPVAAENFIAAVEDINTRWNKLVDGIFDREVRRSPSLTAWSVKYFMRTKVCESK